MKNYLIHLIIFVNINNNKYLKEVLIVQEETNLIRNLPKKYYSTDQPKQHIAKSIRHKIDKNSLSLRKLSEKIDKISYPQIHRITSRQNYNIDTLLKVLDALDLELVIKEKSR
jgi:HTH-type transcriptional regulator / antitoxin HipB